MSFLDRVGLWDGVDCDRTTSMIKKRYGETEALS